MKLCPDHWAQLSEALKAHEVELFVEIRPDHSNDPMVAANLIILRNVLFMEGVRVVNANVCPVCDLKLQGWIEKAAESVARDPHFKHRSCHPQANYNPII